MTETLNGLLLTPNDTALDEQTQAGHAFISEFRDTFRQLAK